jgi:hypothetical protein
LKLLTVAEEADTTAQVALDVAEAAGPLAFLSHGGPVARHFAHGGPAYFAGGGPVAGDTVPAWLNPREGVLTPTGMTTIGGVSGLDALNAGVTPGGMGGRVTIMPSQTVLKLDNRTVGQAVVKWALNNAARGPTSLVGGSLVTGAPGLPASGFGTG